MHDGAVVATVYAFGTGAAEFFELQNGDSRSAR